MKIKHYKPILEKSVLKDDFFCEVEPAGVFRYPTLLALIIFGIISFYILVQSGAIYSGYHLTDDHEMLRIENDLNLSGKNIIKTSFLWIKRDLSIRFRPFYYIHRVLEVYFLGTNFKHLSLYTAILSILSFLLLYLFSQKIGFNFYESILFPCFIFIGPQFCIWWKLGPSETIGMFMLSLSLLFLGISLHSKKYRGLYDTLFVIFLVLSSLSKESFILMMPAILYLKVRLSQRTTEQSFFKTLKLNMFSFLTISLIFFAEIIIIFLYVGTAKIGYAGIDETLKFKLLKRTLFKFFSVGYIPIWIIFSVLIFTIIAVLFINERKDLVKKILLERKEILLTLLLLILVFFPQIVLYTKSGVKDRYFLPFTLGLSIFILYSLKYIRYTGRKFVYFSTLFFLTVAIFLNIYSAKKNAGAFYNMGKINSKLFSYISKKTKNDDPILIASEPFLNYEDTYSMKVYLNLSMKRQNIFFYPVFSKGKYNSFANSVIESYYECFSSTIITKNHNIKELKLIILLSSNLQKTFLKELKMNFDFDSSHFLAKTYQRYFLLILHM